jgi:hypothetical protein
MLPWVNVTLTVTLRAQAQVHATRDGRETNAFAESVTGERPCLRLREPKDPRDAGSERSAEPCTTPSTARRSNA